MLIGVDLIKNGMANNVSVKLAMLNLMEYVKHVLQDLLQTRLEQTAYVRIINITLTLQNLFVKPVQQIHILIQNFQISFVMLDIKEMVIAVLICAHREPIRTKLDNVSVVGALFT